jgi:predicted permease
LFTFSLTLIAAFALSVAPIWKAARYSPSLALKRNSDSWISGTRMNAGRVLSVMQVALSSILLIGAGLFIRSLVSLWTSDPGFSTQDVLIARLVPKPGGYKDLQPAVYFRQVMDDLSRVPGVRSVSISKPAPLGFEWQETVLPAASEGGPRAAVRVDLGMITPQFLQTMGIALIRGRDFSFLDDEHAPRVALVSNSLAKLLFPSSDAVGHRISIGNAADRQQIEIVGVANDANLWNIRSQHPFTVYIPLLQDPKQAGRSVVELRAPDPTSLIPIVRSHIESFGREYPFRLQPIHEEIQESLVQERVTALLAGFFGVLALILSTIGLYGLISYTVSARTAEIGVRMALGATRKNVVRLVMSDVLRIVSLGSGIGVVGGLLLSRLLSSQLYQIPAHDPGTYACVVIVMGLVGVLAAYLPARRASKIDPWLALRSE